MPKVTDAHREARRQQVFDAAFACFARKGFHPTTMQDICQAAGLSPGAVYRYFQSKEEIIEAACSEAQRGQVALLGQLASEPDTERLVHALAEAFLTQMAGPEAAVASRAMVQVWAEAMVNERIGEVNRENLGAALTELRSLVEAAQARGDISPALNPEAVARVMVSFYDGLLLQQALDSSVDAAAYGEAAVALFTGRFWTKDRGQH